MRRWAEAAADSSCRGATRPGRPASPGLSHGDLREQQHRPGLLQPHRRSHDDRGLPFPGESSGLLGAGGGAGGGGRVGAEGTALREPGGSSGRGCGGLGSGRLGREVCDRGKATQRRARTGSFGGDVGLSRDSGMKANCFPCSLAAPGKVREVSTGLPAHFRASPPPRPLRGPPPPPRTPTATGRCPRRVEWGWGRGVGDEAGGGRRFVAAAVSCRDATAVGERGTCARWLPRPPRASAPSVRRGRLAPPPISPLWLGGSRFLHAQRRTLRPALRRLQSAGSQPGRASALALEWGEGERALHKGS